MNEVDGVERLMSFDATLQVAEAKCGGNVSGTTLIRFAGILVTRTRSFAVD
jgi:hypothetical protein